MSGEPLVSVVVAVRNSGGLIRETLEALFAQTLADFEAIVIDDASTDDTPDLLAAISDSRLRFLRNEANLGIAASRNRGLDLVRSPYAAINDHDDLSAPERLARQIAWLDAHPETALLATGARILEYGRLRPDNDRHVADPHALAYALFCRAVLFHSTVCLRMSALASAGVRYRRRFDFAEDLDLYHQIVLRRAGALAWLPQPLAIYRRHAANSSREHSARARAAALAALEENFGALGMSAEEGEVELVWRLVAERRMAESPGELAKLGTALERLAEAYCAHACLSARERRPVYEQASRFWWDGCSRAAGRLGASALSIWRGRPALASSPPLVERLKAYARARGRGAGGR